MTATALNRRVLIVAILAAFVAFLDGSIVNVALPAITAELGGGLRGSLDDALTEAGWAQMEAAVAEAGPWDRLVSSPLQRCARFAEELGEQLGVPVQLDGDRLTVQMHSSNAQLREAMGQGLEQLRASLQQKLGADVQIELRMGSDSSSQQQQQKFGQQHAQQTDSNFHSEAEMTVTESNQSNRLNLVNQLV